MTASSVEFFAYQVPLIGLRPQQSAGGGAAATTVTGGAIGGDRVANARMLPPTRTVAMPAVMRVSRNLFGGPKPGEIGQLLRVESEKQRSYVLKRYNFDINSTSAATAKEESTITTTTAQNGNTNGEPPVQQQKLLPSLIELELLEHEQRLQKEKCNLNRCTAAEITPQSQKQCSSVNSVNNSWQQVNGPIKRNSTISSLSSSNSIASCTSISNNSSSSSKLTEEKCSTISSGSGNSSSNERHKPYARQTLLTDCFNLRKAAQFNGGQTKIITPVAAPIRRPEVFQLSTKPMRVAILSPSTEAINCCSDEENSNGNASSNLAITAALETLKAPTTVTTTTGVASPFSLITSGVQCQTQTSSTTTPATLRS